MPLRFATPGLLGSEYQKVLESHGVTRGPVHKNARVHRGIYGAATSRAVEDVLCSREEAGQPVCQDRGRVTAERRETG